MSNNFCAYCSLLAMLTGTVAIYQPREEIRPHTVEGSSRRGLESTHRPMWAQVLGHDQRTAQVNKNNFCPPPPKK
eukprot:342802-Amphidinium_carterae.1